MGKWALLVAGIALCAGKLQAQPAASPDQPAAPGCVHNSIEYCLQVFRTGMSFDEASAQEQIDRANQKDINGKPLGMRYLTLDGHINGVDGFAMAMLQIGKDGNVESAHFSLPADPKNASTFDEYEKTGLFQALVMMAGVPCNGQQRPEIYRFFENTIKPKISRPQKLSELNEAHASTNYVSSAEGIPYCGAKLSYSQVLGSDTDNITLDNPTGVGGGGSIDLQ